MTDMNVSSLTPKTFLPVFERALAKSIGEEGQLLDEGMRYAALCGGKRVRPLCVFLGARAINAECDLDEIVRLAIGVELIHNYSLVHDDLPAMDNDDFRRGKPSVHKQFGHANGILIGDQLLTQATCELLEGARIYGKDFARAAEEIAFAAKAMVYGQQKDLNGCEGEDEFLDMYSQKTAALIRGSFTAGAICAGASFEKIEKIGGMGENIGIAFQLADDLLDEGEENSIVKAIGADGVRHALKQKTERAIEIAACFANENELVDFATMLCAREK